MLRKGYVDTTSGQVHFATIGNSGPNIVLLHESPLSNRIYYEVAKKISSWGRVFLPDTPGYGQSTPLTKEADLPAYAAALIEAIDSWRNGEKVIIGGIHTGASLCVEIANQAPEMCRGIVPIGLPAYSAEVRAARLKDYAPDVQLSNDGSHAFWAWDRYRNMWPTAPLEHVQLASADLFYNLERYNWAYHQAFKYDAAAKLRAVTCKVLMTAATGEFLFDSTKELAESEGLPFHVFPGQDWQGQVSLNNSDELSQVLKQFSDSI